MHPALPRMLGQSPPRHQEHSPKRNIYYPLRNHIRKRSRRTDDRIHHSNPACDQWELGDTLDPPSHPIPSFLILGKRKEPITRLFSKLINPINVLLMYLCQYLSDIPVYTNAPILNLPRTESLSIIQAGIHSFFIRHCHLPERVLHNNRRVCSYA